MEHSNQPSEETKNQWHNDPDNWIWGIFYYNSKDPRMFTPKRMAAMGWSINFANPNAVFLAVILILVLMILSEAVKR